MHTSRDDSLLGTMRFVSRHEYTQVYGALLSKSMTNQTMLDSDSYKTYSAIATRAEPPKPKKTQKKSDSAISSEETPSNNKLAKSKKDVPSTKQPATKPELTKKKAPVKADRGKGLNVLLEVVPSKAAQLKEATKQSKKDFHISHASGLDDGTDFESGGDSREEEDDDEDDTKDESDNDGNDDDGDNDDDSDDEMTESDKDVNPNLNQSNEEHEEEEEEYADERVYTPKNHELTDEEDNAKEENEEEKDDAEELYRDVNVNLRKEDVEIIDVDQGRADQHNVSQVSGFEQVEEHARVTLTSFHDIQKTEGPMKSSSVSFDFIDKLLKFKNASPADNEIASLIDTTVRHEEPSSQTSSVFTIPVTVIPEITSAFTITIPPPPPSFNPLPQQASLNPTPTASEVTTLFPALPDFTSVFKFNDRVTNLEKDLSEMKQVDQYAQATSSIPVIVDRYIDNKQGEAIQRAIKSHTAEFKEEALAEGSTYAAAASLSKFELTKILMDKKEEHKSYLKANYKRELYDALVKSYNTDNDLFETYGEIFALKRSRDDKDKDQDPSAGSD
ncbi:hypothetical protein Tco_1048309 [Tanacetum coccineum]